MGKKSGFYAVVLAGGGGERFWPFSTPGEPKQFLSVFGGASLIRQSVDRVSELAGIENTLVITGEALVERTRRELPFLPAENIIGEPCRRDTAAACALACGEVARRGGEDAVAAVLPADHLVEDVSAFRRILADAAAAAAKTGAIATLGIHPDNPSTAFGYIERGENVAGLQLATNFKRAAKFVEKPDAATAARYLATGRYVWNAGMFVFRAGTMMKALETEPSLAALAQAVAHCENADGVVAAMNERYPELVKISVDYAVMEKYPDIIVAEGDFGWDDAGAWTAIDRHIPGDAAGNVISGKTALLDCKRVIAMNSGTAPLRVFGVEDLIVAATENGILVASKSRAADLKKIVNALI